MPTVSVIVPTHNRAPLLRSALESVLNQTFQDFEIIVVDDNSQDNTREIVAGYADRRLVYIRQDTNKGVASTRNTGILESTGRYVAFLDDDDEWLPTKLQMQVDLLQRAPSETGGVYAASLKVERSSGRVLSQVTPTKRGDIFTALIADNCIGPTSTVLVKRECFETVGLFDVNIVFGEDVDMWRRIAKAYHFDYIETPLAKFHAEERGLSANVALMIAGIEAMHEKHAHLFAAHSRKDYGRRYLDLGVLYCRNGNGQKGREAFMKGIRLYPFEVRQYFHFLLSLLGADGYRRYANARRTLSVRKRSNG